MQFEGNIRKMSTGLDEGLAQYTLPLFDILEPAERVDMNALIGKEIQLDFGGQINCIATGAAIKKTFGEGLSYNAFMDSPLATPSIIRPELSRIHEGIALRDEAWEREHHLAPHVTYLSLTSEIKVGVTRLSNVPSRWVDQGAEEAVVLAEVPYRQAAGLIEVALKEYLSDKTNWRNMLRNIKTGDVDLLAKKAEMGRFFPAEFRQFWSADAELVKIKYPVERYPVNVKSIKLDKLPSVQKKLSGIKGQYLIFSDDTVMNIRSHAGYRVKIASD